MYDVVLGQDRMFDADAIIYHKEHLVKIKGSGDKIVAKSAEHFSDTKVYSAKHARRAFKSDNVEFAAVLHCCPTVAGGR